MQSTEHSVHQLEMKGQREEIGNREGKSSKFRSKLFVNCLHRKSTTNKYLQIIIWLNLQIFGHQVFFINLWSHLVLTLSPRRPSFPALLPLRKYGPHSLLHLQCSENKALGLGFMLVLLAIRKSSRGEKLCDVWTGDAGPSGTPLLALIAAET